MLPYLVVSTSSDDDYLNPSQNIDLSRGRHMGGAMWYRLQTEDISDDDKSDGSQEKDLSEKNASEDGSEKSEENGKPEVYGAFWKENKSHSDEAAAQATSMQTGKRPHSDSDTDSETSNKKNKKAAEEENDGASETTDTERYCPISLFY